jgi:hypothetical protein
VRLDDDVPGPQTSAYASSGGHTHIRFRSPYAPSIRLTVGQILWTRVASEGNAARSREYGRFHASARRSARGWGAFFSKLFSRSAAPVSISRISLRMAMSASQKRSNSSRDSLSVGSTINVPGTGNETVGGWKP